MLNSTKNTLGIPFSGDTILQGMPELAYVFSRDGRMLMWNKNIEIVLGYNSDELNLKFISDFIADEDKSITLEVMSRIFSDKNEQTLEYKLLTKKGNTLPYIGSGSYAFVDGQEYFIGMAMFLFNNCSKFRTSKKYETVKS